MRVMVWTNSFWPHIGGAEVLGFRLFRALASHGYQLTVITRKDTEDLADRELLDDLEVYRLRFPGALHARSMYDILQLRSRVAELKRQRNPDLYYVYHPTPGILLHQYTRAVAWAPTVATLHQSYPSSAVRRDTLYGQLLRTARWTTTCSASVRERLVEQIPEMKHYSSVILNSLDTPATDPAPLRFDPPSLLCLGRVEHQKGFDLAIECLPHLVERFPGLRLVVAGDGEALSALKSKAVELGVSGFVEFTGWIAPDRVPEILNRASIVLMPSRTEPFGLVALQAAQMGRPVVASDMEGLREVIIHRRTGLLVKEPKAENFSRALESLLRAPGLVAKMGENARKHAVTRFGWDGFVAAYDKLFRRVVVERSMTESHA